MFSSLRGITEVRDSDFRRLDWFEPISEYSGWRFTLSAKASNLQASNMQPISTCYVSIRLLFDPLPHHHHAISIADFKVRLRGIVRIRCDLLPALQHLSEAKTFNKHGDDV